MQAKKLRAKEGNLFKSSFFRAGVVVSVKHISSAPKGESSFTVELQIGGVATPRVGLVEPEPVQTRPKLEKASTP
jgi:hypothetical protein